MQAFGFSDIRCTFEEEICSPKDRHLGPNLWHSFKSIPRIETAQLKYQQAFVFGCGVGLYEYQSI